MIDQATRAALAAIDLKRRMLDLQLRATGDLHTRTVTRVVGGRERKTTFVASSADELIDLEARVSRIRYIDLQTRLRAAC
jgi:hypothetical protein